MLQIFYKKHTKEKIKRENYGIIPERKRKKMQKKLKVDLTYTQICAFIVDSKTLQSVLYSGTLE